MRETGNTPSCCSIRSSRRSRASRSSSARCPTSASTSSKLLRDGYGFSNFTLLGDTVIRYVAQRSRGVLPAGYLDHELVHCWLGNYLHVDYERGNWCEALTTYFTNYGAAVREKRDAAYRRKVSQGFSLRVGPDNDYPLRSFKSKRHDFENDIGYGKGLDDLRHAGVRDRRGQPGSRRPQADRIARRKAGRLGRHRQGVRP